MTPIEIGAVLFSIVGVWLTVKTHILCWFINIIACALYAILFFQERLYADMGLQVAYIVMNCYGWYIWLYGGKDKGKRPIGRVSISEFAISSVLGIIFALFLGFVLQRFTNAAMPFADSLLTGLSLVANWLLARKYCENWLVWLCADTLYVGLFSYRSLWLTAALYAVFIVLAWRGYVEWSRNITTSSSTEPTLSVH